ncbi:MAG: dihydrolipoamide acetyltransferase family protein [Terrimesophilobacter sp.]
MTTAEFALPDAGEGLTEAEIVSWRVQVGESVDVNQVLVEIETAKSLVELPSPFSGVVTAILVSEGQTVPVGTPIIAVETSAPVEGALAPAHGASANNDAVADTAGSISAEHDTAAAEVSGAVLVGYGSRGPARSRRGANKTPVPERVIAGSAVLAKPPVRKLAKDLDVDLAEVTPTGTLGEVTREDVIRQASQVSVFRNLQTPDWADEREERIPVKGVRKAIASAMVSSAFSAPHVSLFVDVDATRTMEFVARLKASADFAGIKVSPLLIMAKAMIWAVRRNPTVNAQWTDSEIIVKHFVNLGIAAATPRGLIVPNVKDAHDLSLVDLASALEQLTITAREGRTSPADTTGGTITITNIGVFGMDTGTPILNPGEVGIVALGTIKKKPWVVDGEVRPRFVTTLGASFDHRVVDGDVASRFLADVASIIEEPALLLD